MPGSEQSTDLLLESFVPRSALVAEDHTPAKARYPAVDVHNHLGLRHAAPGGAAAWSIPDVAGLVRTMDEVGVRVVVNLSGGWGDTLKRNLERYKTDHASRFAVFAGIDWSRLDEPGFGEKMAAQLAESVRAGAQGLKIFKALGLTVRFASGTLLRADDVMLQPIWAQAAELGIPVLFHIADPKAFFTPLDRFNERFEELQEHPSWHFYGPEFPSLDELMEQQSGLLASNPRTKFISAHVASASEDLKLVSGLLDRHPNLHVDISARISELGRQPYSSRAFFVKYQDRVVFGTDQGPRPEMYRIHWRFLETADEHFDYEASEVPGQGRWRIYGVHLPDEVLDKVYRRNAERLVPGLGG